MFPGVGMPEMLFIGVIALLLFGKKLPEVARSLGKGVTEFKKGLRGLEDELNPSPYSSSSSSYHDSNPSPSRPEPRDESVETSAPKFEPPKSEPTSSDHS